MMDFTSLVTSDSFIAPLGDEPQLYTRVIKTSALVEPPDFTRPRKVWEKIHIGTSLSVDAAKETVNRALIESIERYCASNPNSHEYITASASELGSLAVDINTIPRCSDFELSHISCKLKVLDADDQIRWVKASSLMTGRTVYLPFVMVYLKPWDTTLSENFWYPISTGCAAHLTYESALVSAICEVIERDAISLVWLHEIPLPKIEIDIDDSQIAEIINLWRRSADGLRFHIFDATSNLGIPIIYAIQTSAHHQTVRTLVSCSCALSGKQAIVKALQDLSATRTAFRKIYNPPRDWSDFTNIFDGATLLSRPENLRAFSFLLDSTTKKLASSLKDYGTSDPHEALTVLIESLKKENVEAFAVDLTLAEADYFRVKVVRVIIPALQPLTFQYRSRHLGHPRVYTGPRSWGVTPRCETNLNPNPQPFC